MRKLNHKQALFKKEYIVDLNATQAAIRAGYSEKCAVVTGCRLLTNANIAAAIQEEMDKRAKRIEITADAVLQELAKLGFGNSKNLYDADGKLLHVKDMPEEVAATIQEITEDIHGSGDNEFIRRKYKTADKKSSLELLGKHLKLFTDKLEQSGPGGGPIENKWVVEIVKPGEG